MLFVMTFLDVLSARFTTDESVDILDVLEVNALVIERRVALLALDALPSVFAFHVSLKSVLWIGHSAMVAHLGLGLSKLSGFLVMHRLHVALQD